MHVNSSVSIPNIPRRRQRINNLSRVNMLFKINAIPILNIECLYNTILQIDMDMFTNNYKITDGTKITGYLLEGYYYDVQFLY